MPITRIDAPKTFGTIQHPFMIKALNKWGIEGNVYKLLMALEAEQENLPLTSYLVGEEWVIFP